MPVHWLGAGAAGAPVELDIAADAADIDEAGRSAAGLATRGGGALASVNSMLKLSLLVPSGRVAAVGALTSRNSGRALNCCIRAAASDVEPVMEILEPWIFNPSNEVSSGSTRVSRSVTSSG